MAPLGSQIGRCRTAQSGQERKCGRSSANARDEVRSSVELKASNDDNGAPHMPKITVA